VLWRKQHAAGWLQYQEPTPAPCRCQRMHSSIWSRPAARVSSRDSQHRPHSLAPRL